MKSSHLISPAVYMHEISKEYCGIQINEHVQKKCMCHVCTYIKGYRFPPPKM